MAGPRRRASRGATGVEYALIIGVLVLGSLSAITALEDESADYYAETGDDIGDLPDGSTILTTTTGPGGTTTTIGGGTTTTAAGPTSTTAPSVTTSPSTTSTLPPLDPHAYVEQLRDDSTRQTYRRWTAAVSVSIERDDTGGNVSGAQVTGRFTTADGATRVGSCTTGWTGWCQMSWSYRARNDDPTLFEVTAVVASPTWDGSTAAISLQRP